MRPPSSLVCTEDVLTLFVHCGYRIQAEPKLLPQEEVTYAEPVLVPQPPPKLHSPKSTLRKLPHQNNAETLFQFQTDGGYNGRDYRSRDNFGTLRSHQVSHSATAHRRAGDIRMLNKNDFFV